MKKLLVFLVMFSVLISVLVTALTLNNIAFVANSESMAESDGGFILATDRTPGKEYIIEFDGTTSSDALKSEYFGLYLVTSTVDKQKLKEYYDDSGAQPNYKNYLKDAVDGLKPFAYIKGDETTTPVLIDAAKHDLGSGDVGMTIPGNYPEGTYIVSGEIESTTGEKSSVTFKLYITDEKNQQIEVSVDPDFSFEATPNPVNFGTLIPGGSSEKQITLTPGNSDLSVSISISGDAIMETIQDNRDGDYDSYNGDSVIITHNSPISFDLKLDVLAGTSSGDYSATITYTVLEA